MDSILVTADVVGLYPSIPHEAGLKAKQQISGTAIGSKFAPRYACIFMDKVETSME